MAQLENLTQAYRVEIAKEYGVVVAIIYEKVKFWGSRGGRSDGWVYKTYEDMADETGLSPKQIALAYSKLKERKVIDTKVMKVGGFPVLHFRFLPNVKKENDERSKTMENDERSISIYTENTHDKNDEFLAELISLVNKKEKVTAERLRMLNARLKDYSREDILGAAKAFSRSTWHRENGQMSIDNLLAPSKFGRWFAKSNDGSAADATAAPDQWGYKNGQKIFTEDEKGNKYWGGELITPQNQDKVLKERMAE